MAGAESTKAPLPFRGRIYDDITQTIGHTPLIRLRHLSELTGCEILDSGNIF